MLRTRAGRRSNLGPPCGGAELWPPLAEVALVFPVTAACWRVSRASLPTPPAARASEGEAHSPMAQHPFCDVSDGPGVRSPTAHTAIAGF